MLRDARDVRVAEELEQVDDDERLGRARLVRRGEGEPHRRRATGEPVVGVLDVVLDQRGELANDVLLNPAPCLSPQSAKGEDGLQAWFGGEATRRPANGFLRLGPVLGMPVRGEGAATGPPLPKFQVLRQPRDGAWTWEAWAAQSPSQAWSPMLRR